LHVDVVVVCSRQLELSALSSLVRRPRRLVARRFSVTVGEFGPLSALLLCLPQRRADAAESIGAVLAAHRPKWLVCGQLAVALDPSLSAGTILYAAEVANEAGQLIECSGSVGRRPGTASIDGRLVTVRRWPRSAAAKRQLAERTGALAADTAAWLLGRSAQAASVPFAAVAVVVESAEVDSPPESLAVYGPTGSYRAGAVLGASLHGIGRLGTVWKLRAEAKAYAEQLAQAVLELCRQFRC
jgi:hypothetical protein